MSLLVGAAHRGAGGKRIMAKRTREVGVVRAVDHALDVLEAFSGQADELGVTELSKSLGLSKNNVFRLLATFESKDYIEQNPKTEGYRLGLKVFELGEIYRHQSGLLKQARPVLKKMVAKCNEAGYIAVLRGWEVIYLDMVDTTKSIKVISRVGKRLPAYCTAIGKAQLAFESEDEIDRVFRNRTLTRFTRHTITSLAKLKEQFAEIVAKGYSLDRGEYEEEIRCVGVPVRDLSLIHI